MSGFAFKKTSDADYPRYMKILVMGPPKSGKTTFLSTAPNLVVAACEAGLMSVAHKDVAFVDIDETTKLQMLHDILADDTLRAQAAAQLGLPKIETVAIDTLDAWQDMLKKEIMRENKRTVFQRDDWGTLKERMKALLQAFAKLPMNVIFTVHTSISQDEESRMIYSPGLQGAVKDEIAGWVDFSLLAFRQRETNSQGLPVVKYYLKNEGDLKNPHVGNRGAGRVPEICDPDFATLHRAVFTGIPTMTIKEEPVQPEEVAQSLSTPKAPTGVPEDDSDKPINAAGLQMLTKSYKENGLVLPEDVEQWTLGKARNVAKLFVAHRANQVAGNVNTLDDLIGVLGVADAFAGEEGDPKETPTEVDIPKEPVTTPEPEADDTSHDDAVALVESQLGAVEIGREIVTGEPCEVCGNPIDDLDIAKLGHARFGKVLCLSDYKQTVRNQ